MDKIPNKTPNKESSFYLGYFENMQQMEHGICGRSYSDRHFAVVDGEIFLVYKIQPDPVKMSSKPVQYRRSQGGFVNRDIDRFAAAFLDLIRIGVIVGPDKSK